MELKHTKGEWKVSKEPFSLLIIPATNNKVDSICVLSERFKTEEEIIANAKLIASAPTMLEFISRMIGEQNFINSDDVVEAKEIIRKATE